jgi:uncharacterized protein YjbI with pentapeptide repeats
MVRFLTFKDSDAKVLLPSADEPINPNVAATRLIGGDELSGHVVQDLDLEGLSLSKLALRNSVVEDSTFANARVEHVTLERVVLANSTLVGLTVQTLTIRGALFTSCRFDYAQLQDLEVTEGDTSAFLSCSFRDADLTGARAQGAIFHGCDFAATSLTGARLNGADLRGSNLDGARGLSTLHAVTLGGDQLTAVLEGFTTDHRLDVREGSDTGPVTSWREVPET